MIKTLISKASSYLTISLVILCLAMGGVIYLGYARITILNQKVSSTQTALEDSDKTIGVLRAESAVLHKQITDLMYADIDTRKEFDSLEEAWDDLVTKVEEQPAKEGGKYETNDSVNTTPNAPVDLSNHFRLLLESACKANNSCDSGS